MKRFHSAIAVTMLAAAFALPACNTNKPADETAGTIESESVTGSATVQAVDYNARTVTLVWPDGRQATYKVGPEARNFNQIKQGDRVLANVSEAAVVWVGPSGGSPPSAGVDRVVVRSKAGERPGVMVVDSAVISATVLRVDSVNRQITVRGPAGNERVIGVAPQVNLANITVGNLISLRVTESVALWVEQP